MAVTCALAGHVHYSHMHYFSRSLAWWWRLLKLQLIGVCSNVCSRRNILLAVLLSKKKKEKERTKQPEVVLTILLIHPLLAGCWRLQRLHQYNLKLKFISKVDLSLQLLCCIYQVRNNPSSFRPIITKSHSHTEIGFTIAQLIADSRNDETLKQNASSPPPYDGHDVITVYMHLIFLLLYSWFWLHTDCFADAVVLFAT